MSTDHPTPDFAGGFVPRLGADPSSARYELLTATQAVDRVAAVGFDRADAQRMVEQYLAANTAAVGTPPGDGWRVDPYDLAEIARAYDWVDHYRGETIADARARAAQYAADYQRKAAAVDREHDPGYAARVDREAVEWADRACDGHNPWSGPDPGLATAEDTFGDLTEDEEHAEVEAVTGAHDEDENEARTAEQDARSALMVSASWALAARDIAIERGDTEHATRFTHDAREAITAVEAAGITREQLAAELDYPGGAAELDGEHVDIGVQSGEPLTAAQLAGWDAAWDEAITATPPQYPDNIRRPTQTGRGDDETAQQPEAAGPEVVGLVCPECEEDVVERSPSTLVPYEAHGMERPDYSHLDGEPLCPVIGPRGYQPAEPMAIHAASAVEEAHRVVTEVPTSQTREVGEQAHREQLARWDAEPPTVIDDGPVAGAW